METPETKTELTPEEIEQLAISEAQVAADNVAEPDSPEHVLVYTRVREAALRRAREVPAPAPLEPECDVGDPSYSTALWLHVRGAPVR